MKEIGKGTYRLEVYVSCIRCLAPQLNPLVSPKPTNPKTSSMRPKQPKKLCCLLQKLAMCRKMGFSCSPHAYAEQVADHHFTSDEERKQWAEEKWKSCEHYKERQNFPDKLFEGNWKLDERYYYFHKGKTGGKEAEIDETMSREATDASAASSLLALGDQGPKGKGKGADQKFKGLVSKVTGALGKLARSLLSCEQALPGLKRRLPHTICVRLKDGLAAVRNLRDTCLDNFEDLKEAPADGDFTETIDKLMSIHNQIMEGNDTLLEAFRRHQTMVIKEDKDTVASSDARGPMQRQPEQCEIDDSSFSSLVALLSPLC